MSLESPLRLSWTKPMRQERVRPQLSQKRQKKRQDHQLDAPRRNWLRSRMFKKPQKSKWQVQLYRMSTRQYLPPALDILEKRLNKQMEGWNNAPAMDM
jgi:hypothetical protein